MFWKCIGLCLLSLLNVVLCSGDEPNDSKGSLHFNLELPSEEIKRAVSEAIEIVRQQIEVVEPHVFRNGENI
ncbi:UNVERIFIED_CONTAM: hypothetical protein RMT77_018296 [Armadillidium vulgare]